MSDLISRSELIKALDKYCGNQRYLVSENIREIINNQPNAYSVDNVIDKLKELDDKSITRYKNGNFGDFDGVEYYIKKRDAIEIVKQGGVSDDVCEWKMTSTAKYKTEWGYRWEEYFDTKACYCKQCGKKIKVVE